MRGVLTGARQRERLPQVSDVDRMSGHVAEDVRGQRIVAGCTGETQRLDEAALRHPVVQAVVGGVPQNIREPGRDGQ